MRWRIVFVVVGLVAAVVFGAVNRNAILVAWIGSLGIGRPVIWLFAAALAVHLVGHLFRVLRTKIVIDEVNRGSVKGQYGALAVGLLFDALLPLHLGELIRSWIISRTLRVSMLYTLAAVVLERLFDVIFVGVAVLMVAGLTDGQIAQPLVLAAVGLIVVAIAVVVAFVLLVLERRTLLGGLWRLTGLLDSGPKNRTRFSIWTMILGFQRLINDRRRVRRYIAFAAVSWVCYLVSVGTLCVALFPGAPVSEIFVASSFPFIAISSLWGQASLHDFGAALGAVSAQLGSAVHVAAFGYSTWLLLVVPMTVLGVVALLFLRLPKSSLAVSTDATAFGNKLRSIQDISQELPAFLDSYFRGKDLARLLHRIEVAGELSLVRFFRGGSDAVTILALRGGELFVKKVVPTEHRRALMEQRQWLVERGGANGIVRLLDAEEQDDYFSIDLEYRETTEAAFDVVHTSTLGDAKGVISDAWTNLVDHVYVLSAESDHPLQRDRYVEEYLEERVRKATRVSAQLRWLVEADTVVVNGEEFEGLGAVLRRIRSTSQAWNDLASYRESGAIHGDFTLDNLLVDTATGKPIIIDPSDDNELRSPVLDIGRLQQSLQFGYEFLIADESDVLVKEIGPSRMAVVFPDTRSERYDVLSRFVDESIASSFLTPSERRAVPFHTGAFYSRMLTHRVAISPGSAAKYYATSLRALHRFIDQYGGRDS